jgi:hypothetical protein
MKKIIGEKTKNKREKIWWIEILCGYLQHHNKEK